MNRVINDEVVNVHGLSKHFGALQAVDNIHFKVMHGECLGVLGPNGAGKTTTLRMLIGHTIPTSGSLSVLGYTMPKDSSLLRARIGVVPQFDNLDPDFTVIENLLTYASYFGFSPRRIKTKIDALLEFANLKDRAQAPVTSLSGGMKRRLSLARALINTPELLILDEPTTGLDPQARQLMWSRLRELKHNGVTLILSTHYLEEAERLCDRVLVIDHGKILAEGPPSALIATHIEAHVLEVHASKEGDIHDLKHHLPLARMEKVGNTVFCYAATEVDLHWDRATQPGYSLVRRRATLEDVFLKLTGRELRE